MPFVFATMMGSKEFVVLILIGSFAVVFGRRLDGRRFFAKHRSNLKPASALQLAKYYDASETGRSPIKVHVSNIDLQGIHEGSADAPIAYEPFIPDQGPAPVSPSAVDATPCKTVEQWEGRGTEWDHLLGVNNRFNMTYDGKNRRKRVMEDKHAQLPGRRVYEYIMLFDEGIQYVINHQTNTCTTENLGTWRNFTIPPGSTLEDRYEIGPPGSGFMVQEWSDRIPGRKKERWIGTFSDVGCWPVNEVFMERDENLTMIQSVTTKFFDLQVGIKDLSIFTPPSFCHPQTTTTSEPPKSTESPNRDRPRTTGNQRLRFEWLRRLPIFG